MARARRSANHVDPTNSSSERAAAEAALRPDHTPRRGPLRLTDVDRRSLIGGAWIVGLFWCLLSFRWIGWAWAVVFLLGAPLLPRRWRPAVRLAGGLGIAILSFSPIDVTPWDLPGPPQWTEVRFGQPNRVGLRLAALGRIRLGGCTRAGLDPSYVFTW